MTLGQINTQYLPPNQNTQILDTGNYDNQLSFVDTTNLLPSSSNQQNSIDYGADSSSSAISSTDQSEPIFIDQNQGLFTTEIPFLPQEGQEEISSDSFGTDQQTDGFGLTIQENIEPFTIQKDDTSSNGVMSVLSDSAVFVEDNTQDDTTISYSGLNQQTNDASGFEISQDVLTTTQFGLNQQEHEFNQNGDQFTDTSSHGSNNLEVISHNVDDLNSQTTVYPETDNTFTTSDVNEIKSSDTISNSNENQRTVIQQTNMMMDPIAALRLAIPGGGVPGIDYPILYRIPKTEFSCANLEAGYYADTSPEAGCQV